MEIKSIELQNIKGLKHQKIELNLIPNKPNILVAPNGFGKSSIAVGFNSLKSNNIQLNKEQYHEKHENNHPSISIRVKENNSTENLLANIDQNTISEKFDVFVINSRIEPKAKLFKLHGKNIPQPSLEIEPTILVPSIPKKVFFDYSSSKEKEDFGENGNKLLVNISNLFKNSNLFSRIEKEIDFKKFTQKRNSQTIKEIKDEINSQEGTGKNIKEWIRNNLLGKLRSIKELEKLASIIYNFDFKEINNEVDSYLSAFQIISVKQKKGADFKKACKYLHYLQEKSDYHEMISSFDPTRFNNKPEEDNKGRLIVKWPKANEISNGQRDILSFVSLLLKARRTFKKRNCILIIDEIFDYLDDANLISFQYFITQLIEDMRDEKNFFPILLTHLDPMFFNHFCFNKHKLKVNYIKDVKAKANDKLLKIIYNREKDEIKNALDFYFFHYNPEGEDLTKEFKELNLNTDWANSVNFHKKVFKEVKKYLNSEEKFDPIAVCCGVRVQIEKLIYQKINDNQNKKHFLEEENGTKNKLSFCERIGLDIPETYYLLGIIYNNSLHLKQGQDNSKALAIKLNNQTIQKLIQEIFD